MRTTWERIWRLPAGKGQCGAFMRTGQLNVYANSCRELHFEFKVIVVQPDLSKARFTGSPPRPRVRKEANIGCLSVQIAFRWCAGQSGERLGCQGRPSGAVGSGR
jgi:hypothetical protein